jgi:DNA gyrase/topoisomerase IV subunit B
MPDPWKNEPHRYDASMIEVLTLPQAARKRPAMWLGSTDHQGLHRLLEYSVDGLLQQYRDLEYPLDEVRISLEQEGSATITSRGSGASATFFYRSIHLWRENRYPLGVVSALCERLYVAIGGSNNQWHSLLFEQGVLQAEESHGIAPGEECDMWLRLWPDFTILDAGVFDYEQAQEVLRSFSHTAPTLSLIVTDARIETISLLLPPRSIPDAGTTQHGAL